MPQSVKKKRKIKDFHKYLIGGLLCEKPYENLYHGVHAGYFFCCFDYLEFISEGWI